MENKENKFDIIMSNGDTINLSKQIVEQYIAGGQQLSAQEFTHFFQLCKEYQVNPFLKEAYLIKYGSQPATIILDYKVLQKIADSNPAFVGMKTGIVISNNGNATEREGSFILPNEELIAGWCEVTRSDRNVPTKVYAMFSEFAAKNKDGKLNSNWSGKPVFMITKVAKAQALREAFPNNLGSNVYSKEEHDTFGENKDRQHSNVVDVQEEVVNNVGSGEVIDF